MDHQSLFEEVCEVLAGAGFEPAPVGQEGLHVGHRPQGVRVDWRSSRLPEAGEGGPGTWSGPEGSREAIVMLALASLLEKAGLDCAFTAEGDLTVRGHLPPAA